MAVNLVKGQKVDLRKDSGGSLNKVMVGLGWDEAKKSGGLFGSLFGSGNANIDCDASVILCGADGKVAGHNLTTMWSISPTCAMPAARSCIGATT